MNYAPSNTAFTQNNGDRYYELSNHLGNVLSVVSDRLIPTETSVGSGLVDYYSADIVSSSDYYAFGMGMPERKFSSEAYRYGFNGMEKDDELKGSGNSYTTEFRQYDSRLGRWLSMDPITHHLQSPYCAFDNNPIYYKDPRGADGEDPPKGTENDEGDYTYDYQGMETNDELPRYFEHSSNSNAPSLDIDLNKINTQSGMSFIDYQEEMRQNADAFEKRFNAGYVFKPLNIDLNYQQEFSYNYRPFESTTVTNNQSISPVYISSLAWGGFVSTSKYAFNIISAEVIRQQFVNNSLMKNPVHIAPTGVKLPASIRFIGKYGGYVFSAYFFYETGMQYFNGEISGTHFVIEEVSNGISCVPIYGSAWSFGWNMGKSYGPRTWHGNNDLLYFE